MLMMWDLRLRRQYKRPTSIYKTTTVPCSSSSRSPTSSSHGVRLSLTHTRPLRAANEAVSPPTDMSPLSAEYRSSMTDSDPDSDDNNDDAEEAQAPGGRGVTTQGRRPGAVAHRRGPGHLTMTPALLSAFTASLDAHKVRLRFFAGGWASLRELLLLSPQPQPPPPYDVVLASRDDLSH